MTACTADGSRPDPEAKGPFWRGCAWSNLKVSHRLIERRVQGVGPPCLDVQAAGGGAESTLNELGEVMSTPAGWYPQPDGQQRYWDGEQWTEDFEAGAGTPVTTGATGGQQARLRFKKKHVIGYTATAL